MLITNNETVLRTPCQVVLPEEVASLIEALEKELEYGNKIGRPGIGLAAPQIGIAKQAAIIRLPKLKINLINAKLKEGYDSALFQDEGCLSFPGKTENTLRFQEVVIIDNLVAPYNFVATGLVAVACQHELDHLNSVLFMDRKVPKPVPIVNKTKTGPNDPCFCGSGKKTKKCHRK